MTATLEQMIADWLESVEPASTLQRVWKLRGQPNDWTLENVPNAVVDEFNRLGALHSGGLPVQAPVFVDETEEHFGRPGLVIGYIDGEPDLNPDDPNKYVEQFAHLLAQIHHFDPKTSGLALAERPVRQFARFMKDDMPQANPVFQVDRIWAALASNCIRRDKEQAVLLHGDFWPGNTLWRNGSLLAVIDWEQPAAGDPLLDLSISCLELWWVLGDQGMHDFTERYLVLHPIDTSLLPLYDLCTALRPVTNLAEWAAAYPPLGRPDISLESMRREHSRFVSQAFDQLDKIDL